MSPLHSFSNLFLEFAMFIRSSAARAILIKGLCDRSSLFSSSEVSSVKFLNMSISYISCQFFHTEISVRIRMLSRKIVLLPMFM